MGQLQSVQSPLHQLGDKLPRADLHQPGRALNQVGFPNGAADPEDPARPVEHALVRDAALVEIPGSRGEADLHAVAMCSFTPCTLT